MSAPQPPLDGAKHRSTAIINDDQGPLWYRGLAQPLASNNGETLAAPTPAQIQPAGEDQLMPCYLLMARGESWCGHTPILSGIALVQTEADLH